MKRNAEFWKFSYLNGEKKNCKFRDWLNFTISFYDHQWNSCFFSIFFRNLCFILRSFDKISNFYSATLWRNSRVFSWSHDKICNSFSVIDWLKYWFYFAAYWWNWYFFPCDRLTKLIFFPSDRLTKSIPHPPSPNWFIFFSDQLMKFAFFFFPDRLTNLLFGIQQKVNNSQKNQMLGKEFKGRSPTQPFSLCGPVLCCMQFARSHTLFQTLHITYYLQ